MDSLLCDFQGSIADGRQLAIMPVSRFIIENNFRIGRFVFYPPGNLDLDELRTIPNHSIACSESAEVITLQGQELREALTSLTGASIDTLRENMLIAFPTKINWDTFLQADHKQDVKLIRRLSEVAEKAMDLIRFNFCHYDLPDTLPGRVGTWNGSGQHSCILLYSGRDHESYLIAGSAILSSIIVKGLGLELESLQCDCAITVPEEGEVGSIVRHGLSLFSEVMESNSETTKFVRALTLLEYLAAPDMYMSMKKVKTSILPHIATDLADYHHLSERFRELTSQKEAASNEQRGFRTLIVHHGRYLEDILPDDHDRNDLFRELQRYTTCVLQDMLENSRMTWVEFMEFRIRLRAKLGLNAACDEET